MAKREVKRASHAAIVPAVGSSPLASSSKRQKVADKSKNSVSDGSLSNVANSGLVSSLWLEDDEIRVGLCFKDKDELKKAVDWWSIRRERRCSVRETEKEKYVFECIRWKCNWSLSAARMEEHGLVEITKCNGPHKCGSSVYPVDVVPEFIEYEIERVVKKQPTISVTELNKMWKDKFDYELETWEVQNAKDEAIKKVFGDWDQSFRVLPKLMAALHSSNGMVVDWKYDVSPNPDSASFSGVFWAIAQSIEGFQHCRPLIVVDHTEMYGEEYQLNLLIASGVDATNNFFPLAFAVTKEVTADSWRWFLNGVREKVTQRKGLCLISSPHPDILAVIKEPESRWQEPWAYHRFCLSHLRSQFTDVFKDGNLEYILREAASTSQKEELDSNMKDIEKMNPKARKWLNQFTPNQWALAHDNGLRYGIMEINTEDLFAVCEVFQQNEYDDKEMTLTGSLLLLFDKIRETFEESFSSSRGSLSRGDVYTEPVTEKLEEFMKDSATYNVKPLAQGDAFQVSRTLKKKERTLMGRKTDTSTICIVRLNESTCTCGKFQKKKFPCLHALAVCKKLKINPLQYVDDCYTVERYHKTYAVTFNSVPEVSAWPEAFGVPTLCPPPRLPNSSASPDSSHNWYDEEE